LNPEPTDLLKEAQKMPRFLVKAGLKPRGRNSVVVADDLHVEFPIKYREKGRRDSPLGEIREMESTGQRDRGLFRFRVREGTFGTGGKTSRSRCQADSPTTAAGVKKVVRALRPQEEEKLAAIDARRRELYEQIDAVETERDEFVRQAFSKGNVVRITELEAMAEEDDRIWKERKRILNTLSLSERSVAELRELLETDFAKSDVYVTERINTELEGRG
jgi:hypothetical protein